MSACGELECDRRLRGNVPHGGERPVRTLRRIAIRRDARRRRRKAVEVAASSCQAPAVGMKRDVADTVAMFERWGDGSAGRGLPDARGAIGAPRGDVFAVGTETSMIDVAAVL